MKLTNFFYVLLLSSLPSAFTQELHLSQIKVNKSTSHVVPVKSQNLSQNLTFSAKMNGNLVVGFVSCYLDLTPFNQMSDHKLLIDSKIYKMNNFYVCSKLIDKISSSNNHDLKLTLDENNYIQNK